MDSKPVFVFDWDGVVFNSDTLKEVIFGKLHEELGCPRGVFDQAGGLAKSEGAGYSPLKHARFIAEALNGNPQEAEKMIYDSIETYPGGFVFPDARELLAFLKLSAFKARVLSAGETDYQKYKINLSGLSSNFAEVHIVDSGEGFIKRKMEILRELASTGDKVIFMDDRPDTIAAVTSLDSLSSSVLPLLVWRSSGQPPSGLDFVQKLNWPDIQEIAIHKGFGSY